VDPVTGPLPEQWTANPATIAATLSALKAATDRSFAPDPATTPAERIVVPGSAPPSRGETGRDEPLPTRRSMRETAQHNRATPANRARVGLFSRILTVRAYRSHRSPPKAVKGPVGVVGDLLLAASIHGVHTLYRRRIPGQRGQVDYLAISDSGVYVVDVKHCANAPIELLQFDDHANTPPRLMVGGRDMTTAATATARRVAAIRAALDAAGHHDVPVTGALCFVDGLLPLGATELLTRGVHVMRPSALTALVSAPGSLTASDRTALQNCLSEHFPQAF
jgi:hypothetical protein